MTTLFSEQSKTAKLPLPYTLNRFVYSRKHKKKYKAYQEKRLTTHSDYSYKPFDDTKSFFIHIPKAAGISVCKSLYGNLAGGHTSMREYRIIFSKKEFKRYFKFTIVRNPWDRLFSAYHFLKNGGINEKDAEWSKNNISEIRDFEDFVLNWLTSKSIYSYIHFIPQTSLLSTSKKQFLELDFIGFFENIEADFEQIKTRVNPNATLSHKNKSNHQNGITYKDAYSMKMIKKVSSIYQDDINALNYSFANETLPQQLRSRLVL